MIFTREMFEDFIGDSAELTTLTSQHAAIIANKILEREVAAMSDCSHRQIMFSQTHADSGLCLICNKRLVRKWVEID